MSLTVFSEPILCPQVSYMLLAASMLHQATLFRSSIKYKQPYHIWIYHIMTYAFPCDQLRSHMSRKCGEQQVQACIVNHMMAFVLDGRKALPSLSNLPGTETSC